jgi:hypothetical protein
MFAADERGSTPILVKVMEGCDSEGWGVCEHTAMGFVVF